jgi:hypothetical protein
MNKRSRRGTKDKSELGLFLGYKGEDLKIVLAWNLRTKSIGEYYHVIFHEGVFVGHNPTPQKLQDLLKMYPLLPGDYFTTNDNQDDLIEDSRNFQEDSLPTPMMIDEYNIIDEDYLDISYISENDHIVEQLPGLPNWGLDELNNYDEASDMTYQPSEFNDDSMDQAELDANFLVGADVSDTDASAFAARQKKNKAKAKNSSNTNRIFTQSVPDIDWSIKAESSYTTKPIPNGHLRKIPTTLKEALSRPDEAPFWLAAMHEEVNQLVETKTWEETFLPDGRKLLTGKWVFAYKLDEEGVDFGGGELLATFAVP